MYTAYVLSAEARSKILAKFQPKFPDVIAHHVTKQFGLGATAAEISCYSNHIANVTVIGYVCDDSLEALIVTVNGKYERPDGKIYHITLSLDKSKGRKPVESNTVIANSNWKAAYALNLGDQQLQILK